MPYTEPYTDDKAGGDGIALSTLVIGALITGLIIGYAIWQRFG